MPRIAYKQYVRANKRKRKNGLNTWQKGSDERIIQRQKKNLKSNILQVSFKNLVILELQNVYILASAIRWALRLATNYW